MTLYAGSVGFGSWVERGRSYFSLPAWLATHLAADAVRLSHAVGSLGGSPSRQSVCGDGEGGVLNATSRIRMPYGSDCGTLIAHSEAR